MKHKPSRGGFIVFYTVATLFQIYVFHALYAASEERRRLVAEITATCERIKANHIDIQNQIEKINSALEDSQGDTALSAEDSWTWGTHSAGGVPVRLRDALIEYERCRRRAVADGSWLKGSHCRDLIPRGN